MNTTAQVKQAIKKSAQQVAQEPLEILKSAAQQVASTEQSPSVNVPQNPETQSSSSEVSPEEQSYKKQVAEQDGRHLQALESELKDIRRQKIFNELLKRIQSGEGVPLEEFTELSFEQRDVLKAQMEAVKIQNQNSQNMSSGLIEPNAKKGRQMGGGQKKSAQQQTTRVEKPVPPSG